MDRAMTWHDAHRMAHKLAMWRFLKRLGIYVR